MNLFIETSPERKLKVYEILSQGSNPRGSFFALVALSTLIAAFGLVMNSTAVVIGAMLVAPLMTPILGIALSLVRGDPALLTLASRSEVAGVVTAVLASAILGWIIPYFEVTPEMLSRTNPNLLDLLVAVLAGLAGAYAIVDVKIGPALPGVAISVAIVPPLANTGLSLALGAFAGAWGSFLLFFTNFLSILLASALIFVLSGMAVQLESRTHVQRGRRFGVAVAGFLIVAALLSYELFNMIRTQRLRSDIQQVLEQELSRFRVSDLEKLVLHEDTRKVKVLAHVHAPSVLTPRQVKSIEQEVERRVGTPTEIFLRTTMTQDVSATGSVRRVLGETLDGFFLPQADEGTEYLRIAEQVVREYFNDKFGVALKNIQSIKDERRTLFFVHISGFRPLRKGEMTELEQLIQEKLRHVPIKLIVGQENIALTDSRGRFRTEFTMRRALTPKEQSTHDKIYDIAEPWFRKKGYALDGWSVMILEDKYHAFFEAKGPQLMALDTVKSLELELTSKLKIPMEIFVRSVPEAIMTTNGYTTLEELLNTFGERTRRTYDKETREILQTLR